MVLADDQQLVRAGIRALIEKWGNYRVVAEADDGEQAFQHTAEQQPDILVLDLNTPRLNGLEVLSRVRQASPRTKVLIVSMQAHADFVMRALREQASGYLLKNAAPTELGVAMDAMRQGRYFLSPAVSGAVVERALAADRPCAAAASACAKPVPLTPRQREVLTLLASGESMKEVAHRLSLSVKTVETHRAQIMDRLDIHDLPRLVLYAVRHRLVPLHPPTRHPAQGASRPSGIS